VQHGGSQDSFVRDIEDVADDKGDSKHVTDVRRLIVFAELMAMGAGGEGHRIEQSTHIVSRLHSVSGQ
jgi:hypothetical protein